LKKCIGRNIHRVIVLFETGRIHDVRARGRITDLLDNVVDLVDGLLRGSFIHPLRGLELLGELCLDVCNDGIAKLLGCGRECFLNKESTQDPANTIINVANTLSPSLRCGIRVLRIVSTWPEMVSIFTDFACKFVDKSPVRLNLLCVNVA